MDNADFLAEIDLFRELPPDLRELVSELFEERVFEDDEIVFRVGDSSNHIFVVRFGAVVVFSDTVGEVVELKARIKPGGVFGEVGVLQGSGRTLSARASGVTTLLLLDGRSLLDLAGADEELAFRLSKISLRYSFENRSSKVELASRTEARIRLGSAIELRMEGSEAIPVTLENLSLGGACLSGLPADWDIGEGNLMSLAVDPQTTLLSIYGRVAWRRPGRLGIAFTETLPDHEIRVAGTLHRLTDALLSASA